MDRKNPNLQALVNAAHAPHTPPPPALNPGAGLVAEGMRPLDRNGHAVAHDRGNHDHKEAK